MANLDVTIADRTYRVACKDGEEPQLTEAARLFDAEASTLKSQLGRGAASLPEAQVLMMSGLLLANRFREHLAGGDGASREVAETAGADQAGLFEDPAQAARIAELEDELSQARAALDEAAAQVRALAADLREEETA